MPALFMFQFVKTYSMNFAYVIEALRKHTPASGIIETKASELDTPEEYEFMYSYLHGGNKDHEESFVYKFYPHINKGIYLGKESNFGMGEIKKYAKFTRM